MSFSRTIECRIINFNDSNNSTINLEVKDEKERKGIQPTKINHHFLILFVIYKPLQKKEKKKNHYNQSIRYIFSSIIFQTHSIQYNNSLFILFFNF